MTPYSKSAQTGRQPARRRRARNSTLAAPTAPLAPQSAKRAAVYEAEYLPARTRFLQRHRVCQMQVRGVCTKWATEIHHMKQRSTHPGTANLLDETFWRAACRACNGWAEAHPKEAEAKGLVVK